MGNTIQQYRAAIGLYGSVKSAQGKNVCPFEEEEQNLTAENDPHDHSRQKWQGPWKWHALALCLMFVMITPIINADCVELRIGRVQTQKGTYDMLTTMLPPNCIRTLLVIGGIEQNPGPAIETAEQKAERLKKQQEKCDEYNRIIAELVTKAPNEQTKDCIRLYNPENNLKKHHRAFNSQVKDVLVETLTFLGFPGKEEYDKETVVHDMVCAIQNYLPDTCRICKDEYRTRLGETPLLKCCKCGQGVHNKCFKDMLGLPDGDGDMEISADEVMKTIDPTRLQGLHYFCGGCEKLIIPSPEDGKLRKHITTDKEPPAGTRETHETDKEAEQTHENDDVEAADETTKSETTKSVPACTCNKTVNAQTTNCVSEEVPVCKFYRQNKCRYKNPKECKFLHPRPCKKLVQHGTNEQRGCTLGKKCSEYHPIMCRDSLTKGICFNESCRKSHIRGTKRTPNLACKQSVTEGVCLDENCKLTHVKGTRRTMDPDKRVSFQNETQSQNSNYFLEELRSLKVDMLREVDKMITLRLGYPHMQTPTYAEILKNNNSQIKPDNQTLLPGAYRLVQANNQPSPENQGILKLVQAH
jgi:hypothetical protein